MLVAAPVARRSVLVKAEPTPANVKTPDTLRLAPVARGVLSMRI